MSLSNLLAPNNYDLYINTLNTNTLNTNTLNTNTINSNSINTGTLGVTGNANINGILNLFELNLGNSIGPTGFQPYFSANTANYTGLFDIPNVPTIVRLLSIGNFVFLYINTLGVSDSSYTATNALMINGLIPTQFRPANDIYCSAICINNSAPVPGIGVVYSNGDVWWGLSGNTFINFNGASGIAGARSLIACWTIN
jgi:hypothetical protein